MSPSRCSSRSTRWRPMNPVAPVTKYAMSRTVPRTGGPDISRSYGLPAAGPVRRRHPALSGGLARVSALVEPPLQQAQQEDQRREERDHDEAGVRDDLVVRLAVRALAAVRRARERERGEHEQQQAARDAGGEDVAQALHAGRNHSGGSGNIRATW